MRTLFRMAAVIAAVIGIVSCDKEDPIPAPVQPEGYLRLLDLYDEGAEFVSYEQKGALTTLIFEESSVVLNNAEIEFHDCSRTGRPPIFLNEAQTRWLVNGEPTKIGNHTGMTDRDAQPVYIYVDDQTLNMFISNRHQLRYTKYVDTGYRKPKEFTMPVVRITFNGTEVQKDTYSDGTITIEDPDMFYSETAKLESDMQIKGRGNSTWGMPKKPYRIKLSKKQEVLGMPSSKNWALLANYADKSLMRNNTAMELSRILGFRWTPKSRDVEVYLNGKYQGVYSLFEHKEVGKNKVNIADDEYYLEVEQSIDEPFYFFTGRSVPIQFKNPEEPTQEQFDYIKKYFKDFETALFGSSFKDPSKGYAAYIDVDSFIDNFIIEELAKDIDGNVRKSSFLTLQKGGKLTFYHQWDFDLSFGNADYFPGGANGPTGWWVKDHDSNSNKNAGWYWKLFQDEAFVKKVKARWNEVYPRFKLVPNYIDLTVQEMGKAPDRNFNTWRILNTYVWPNVKVTGSYSMEVKYLKDFYSERLEWMNKNINDL